MNQPLKTNPATSGLAGKFILSPAITSVITISSAPSIENVIVYESVNTAINSKSEVTFVSSVNLTPFANHPTNT